MKVVKLLEKSTWDTGFSRKIRGFIVTDEVTMLKGGVAADDRGSVRFVNDFSFDGVKRFYQVENVRAGFIRAWHGHLKEGKYVYVPRGSILLGVCDLNPDERDRLDRPDLGPPQKFVLSSQAPGVLWVPPGKANGFKTLEEGTIVMFFSTSFLEESKGDDYRYPFDYCQAHDRFWNEDFR